MSGRRTESNTIDTQYRSNKAHRVCCTVHDAAVVAMGQPLSKHLFAEHYVLSDCILTRVRLDSPDVELAAAYDKLRWLQP